MHRIPYYKIIKKTEYKSSKKHAQRVLSQQAHWPRLLVFYCKQIVCASLKTSVHVDCRNEGCEVLQHNNP